MRFLDHIDRGAIGEMLGRDEYFWLDLDAPSDAEVSVLDDLFHWHPLALEDMRKKGQRPKLEDYDQYMFLVYYGAAPPEGGAPPPPDAPVSAAPARGERVDLEEVHAFIRDSFFPLLVDLEDGLEHLDEEIFNHPSPDHLQPLTELRRDLVMLGRVATPQRDMLARHIDDILQLPGLEKDSRDYFRDVYDHAIRISDQVDSFRDLLLGSRDAYLSVTSNRLNEISKQLTVVATIFLPLSFVVGFFGQNFGWMVRNINSAADFWLIGGGSMVLSVVILVLWLRRSSYT